MQGTVWAEALAESLSSVGRGLMWGKSRACDKADSGQVSFGPASLGFIFSIPYQPAGWCGVYLLDTKDHAAPLGLKSGRRNLHTRSGNRVPACSTLHRSK
jgi:hypothetical protein